MTGGIIKVNPAAAVRGPRYSASEGKTPILTGDEPRRLLEAIKTDSLVGLRDRAFIGLLLYTACRVNAAVSLKVEDYYSQGSSWFLRLREKGGKRHVMPCNHHLQEYMAAKRYMVTNGASTLESLLKISRGYQCHNPAG